jgi:hypothetical protein
MQDILINKLHEYIKENNPDILIMLQENNGVTKYLRDKVTTIRHLLIQLQQSNTSAYIIEEVCLEELTKDLRPSKFNYISSILEEDFENAYEQLQESGTLTYEVINMIAYTKPVFDVFEFTQANENDRQLKYAVTGAINEYLTRNQ